MQDAGCLVENPGIRSFGFADGAPQPADGGKGQRQQQERFDYQALAGFHEISRIRVRPLDSSPESSAERFTPALRGPCLPDRKRIRVEEPLLETLSRVPYPLHRIGDSRGLL